MAGRLYVIVASIQLLGAIAEGGPAVGATGEAPTLSLRVAIETALENLASIRISRCRVESSRGVLDESRGRFDWTAIAAAGYADVQEPQTVLESEVSGESFLDSHRYQAMGGLRKTWRNGIRVEPTAEWTRRVYGGGVTESADRSAYKVAIILPLLKGRGREAAGAEELASECKLRASELELRHAIATGIRDLALAYWACRSVEEQLAIYRESESDAQLLFSRMQKMVQADEAAPADLHQVSANLADRQAECMENEQRLVAARAALAVAMGIDPGPIASFPSLSDPFPTVAAPTGTDIVTAAELVALAMASRDDLKAARLHGEAAEIVFRSAQREAKAQLNLVLDGGVVQDEDPAYAEETATVAGVSLKFEHPLFGRSGKGRLAQAGASRQESVLQVQDLERRLSANVLSAQSALRLRGRAVEQTRRAVESYGKAVESEAQKLRMGMGTVLDVMTMADRLRSSRLSEVSGRQGYAEGLVQLRFETGTLVAGQDGGVEVTEDRVVTAPSP